MKIGIITMHRVKNCGSNLQAYALQHKLQQMGHDAELIDYYYQPPSSKTFSIQNIISFILDAITGFPKRRQRSRFKKFQEKYYHTSKFYDKDSIKENPPVYDLYMSGSDQVWNPRYIKDDTNFMLSFADASCRKVSYASSFACAEIPEEYAKKYADALNQYDKISVREQAGIDIVKKLTGKDAQLACDPVLLLGQSEWSELAGEVRPYKEPYILVYTLAYMFNPRPGIYNIIDTVQKKLGYKVIYLNGTKEEKFKPNSKVVKDFGPIEFLQWIKNAEFVITDSFHCTAFSVIFSRPLMGVVKSIDTKDGRLTTLLKKVGAERSIVIFTYPASLDGETIEMYQPSLDMLDMFRKQSTKTLNYLLSSNTD